MDVRQQRAVRNAQARILKAQAELEQLEAGAKVQESVDQVLTALNHYRRFRICIQWCLIIALIPFFLFGAGIFSPYARGWYIEMIEFGYYLEFISWTVCWFLLAALFNGAK